MLLCRYADDFVCAFEDPQDAERFYQELGSRLQQFGLEVAADKTKIIPFDKPERRQDSGSFDFLGFEFRWDRHRRGKSWVRRRTSRKKLRKSLETFKEWIRKNRSVNLGDLMKILKAKLQGYYNYYGLKGNIQSLGHFYWRVKQRLYKWLNRRSQRKSFTIESFNQLLKHYRVVTPHITEKPDIRVIPLGC